MKRDYRDYLEDILAAIDESAEFTRDISFEVFTQDRKTFNAVVRNLDCLSKTGQCCKPFLVMGKTLALPLQAVRAMNILRRAVMIH